MFCHGISNNTDHKSRDCPVLRKLGVKLEKCSDGDNCEAATHVASNSTTPGPAPSAATAVSPLLEVMPGSNTIPGRFAASVKVDAFDSGDEYEYEEKALGTMYFSSPNTNNTHDIYLCSTPSCRHSLAKETITQTTNIHTSSWTASDSQGVNTIYLPRSILDLLQNHTAHQQVPNHSIHSGSTTLVVADMGATNHMLPDKSAFISYTPVTGRHVCHNCQKGICYYLAQQQEKNPYLRLSPHARSLQPPLQPAGTSM